MNEGILVFCVVMAVIAVVLLMFFQKSHRLEVGATWRIDKVWSGYAIASPSRADGGSKYIRIDDVKNGKVLVDGSWIDEATFRSEYISNGTVISGPQTLRRVSTFIGKTEDPLFGRSNPRDRAFSNVVRQGGIDGARTFLQAE